MKREFRFYLDNNSNLHVREKGADIIQYVQYPLWIEDFKNFEQDIDKLDSSETYAIEEFKEFEVDEDGFIVDTWLEEKDLKEIAEIIEQYYEKER